MTKKGSWISALKKALSPESKGKKDKKTHISNSKRFGKHTSPDPGSSHAETAFPAPASPPIEEENFTEAENEQNKHAYSVALATAAVAAEAAVAAAEAAAEVVRLTTSARYSGKFKEEVAAIKIQTAFRGYLARRALSALRGLVRLKSLIQGQSVKRQSTTTLQCMQTVARVQSQVRARRIRMSEENQALQRQLQQKHEKELEKLRTSVGEDWNDSVQSKEQIEGKLQSRQEAAMRRERALAYAYSSQQRWKNSSKSANPTFMDPNNPHWGWSWLERWMAARPWETRGALDGELNSDHASVKSANRAISVSELNKAHSQRNLNLNNKPSPTSQKPSRLPIWQSPSTPTSKAPSMATKTRPASSKGSSYGGDDDSRSVLSVKSERFRRHSIGGSSVRDDESLASVPAVSSYTTPKKSEKSKSGLPGPSKNGTPPEKGSVSSARKRLSYPSSPAGTRRLSGPPKLETGSVKDINMRSKEKFSNGAGNTNRNSKSTNT